MELTIERKAEIHDALFRHFLKKYEPDKLFPDKLSVVAKEIGVRDVELMEFLNQFFNEYFGG